VTEVQRRLWAYAERRLKFSTNRQENFFNTEWYQGKDDSSLAPLEKELINDNQSKAGP
jgi:hypothetical protein